MPAISVIIVNWNGGQLVQRCLDSLRRQTFTDFETIVVDNASTDGSADLVAERFPGVHLLRQSSNSGFAAANNAGAQAAAGAWLALLNADAFPEPTWLEALYEVACRKTEYVGFASLQLQAHDPTLIDGAGDAYHASGVPWRIGFDQPFGTPWDMEREIFSPCACAALYRHDAFQAVGGFDESFFCYLEDVDLAFRMQLQGGRFMYVPDAVVHHVGSASTGKTSDFARYHGHRNLVWCFVKNMPLPLLWKHLPAHLAVNLLSLAMFSFRREGRPIWQAKWDALRGLPRVLRERRAVQQARRAAPAEIERRMAHGLKPLMQRSRTTP